MNFSGRILAFFISMQLFLGSAISQEAVTLKEEPKLFMSMGLKPTDEDVKKEQSRLIEKKFNDLFSPKGKGNGYLDAKPTLEEELRIQELFSCLQSAFNDSVFKTLDCRSDLKALLKGNTEPLRRRGLPIPEEFYKNLENEMNYLQKTVQEYQKEDEVLVIENALVLEETGGAVLLNAQAIDPQIVQLSKSMNEIVLEISKSKNFNEAIDKQKGKDVPDELFVLGEMLHFIAGENCDQADTFVSGQGGYLLQDILLEPKTEKDKTKKEKDTANVLLAVKSEKDLANIESYKFIEDGVTYYLYRGREKLNQQDWIMAKLPSDGKMTFRYFKLIEAQPEKTKLNRRTDISIIKPGMQQTTIQLENDKKFYFQAQEGIVIKSGQLDVPLIGKTSIPEAKLIIGKVHMAYSTKSTFSQTDVTVRHDDVLLSTSSQPLSSKWSVGGNGRYSPLTGNWDVNSNVRVQNFLIGYGHNSSNQSSASVSYVLEKSFITLQAPKNGASKMSLGHQFGKGRGFVMAASDFQRVHEIKFVYIVK